MALTFGLVSSPGTRSFGVALPRPLGRMALVSPPPPPATWEPGTRPSRRSHPPPGYQPGYSARGTASHFRVPLALSLRRGERTPNSERGGCSERKVLTVDLQGPWRPRAGAPDPRGSSAPSARPLVTRVFFVDNSRISLAPAGRSSCPHCLFKYHPGNAQNVVFFPLPHRISETHHGAVGGTCPHLAFQGGFFAERGPPPPGALGGSSGPPRPHPPPPLMGTFP